MPGERRTQEEILTEIRAEREGLADALADLRQGVAAKRNTAAVVGGMITAGLTAVIAVKIARRLRGA